MDNIINLLYLKNNAKSGSKAPTKVTFVVGCDGLTSTGMSMHILLDILIKFDIYSLLFFLNSPNSVK
jgi:hypothetical protein